MCLSYNMFNIFNSLFYKNVHFSYFEFFAFWLVVDGFLFLLIGTALYNQLVDIPWIPWLRRPEEMKPIDTTVTVASPKHVQGGSFEDSYKSIDEHSRLIDSDEVEPSYT